MIFGSGTVISAWGALALAGPPQLSPELTLGAKTRPVGMAVLTDLFLSPADDPDPVGGLEIGGGLDVYFYWYEAQLRAREVIYGGFLILNGTLAWEPGWFVPADALKPGDPATPRRFSSRPLARGRIELNLRDDLLWLYVRNTGLARHRRLDEYDPFRDQRFRRGLELSGEHSAALMVSPSGGAARKVWLYAEITLEASVGAGVGWIDRLPRGGVIVEQLASGLSLDLDLYHSLMDNKLGGTGSLLVLWWQPGA